MADMVNLATIAPVGTVPTGTMIELPGRGSTYLIDSDDGASDRPTMILLHSLTCTGILTWYPVFERLSRKGRVVVFDQRWHGRGIRSPRFTLEDCADDVAAVADYLDVDRFVAVGYSMGSLIGQLVWKQHRDRLAGLVLCAAASSFRGVRRERIFMDAFGRAVGALNLGAGALPGMDGGAPLTDRKWALEQFRQTRYGAMAAATAAIGKFDSSAWIGDIDVPTSVVVTARDRAIKPERQRWLARQIAGASSYEVDCGHASCVMEAEVFSSGLMPACASVLSRARL